MNETSLKNTKWVLGFCVYTGVDTKIMLNAEKGSIKRSKLDRNLSTFIFYILCAQIVSCSVIAIIASTLTGNTTVVHHYLPHEAFVSTEAVYAFFRYFLLMSTCVPISLMVSLECCKAI